MAKKAAPPAEAAPGAQKSGDGQSVMGYFRRVFEDNPHLLNERSNEALWQRWLADHPGEKEVPERVKQSLANIKSLLRKKAGRRGRKRREEQPAQGPAALSQPTKLDRRRLEELEHHIDEVLQMAKGIDREGLAEVVLLLRAARNRVVIQVGWE